MNDPSDGSNENEQGDAPETDPPEPPSDVVPSEPAATLTPDGSAEEDKPVHHEAPEGEPDALGAFQREMRQLRKIDSVQRSYREALEANRLLQETARIRREHLEVGLGPYATALARLREDIRRQQDLLGPRSLAAEAAAAAEMYEAARHVRDQSLTGAFADYFREHRRVREIARQLYMPSLATALAASAAASVGQLGIRLPEGWGSLAAEIRRAIATAPTVAEYNGISWALDLQNTQEAEATMIAEMAAQAAVEGGSRQPGAHREGDEVSDAAAEQLTPATIEAISEVPSQDLAAVVQSDERLFALVAHVWAEVLKRLPDAQSANGAGFALFLTLLFYVFPTPYDVVTAYRDGVERNRDAIEQEVHQRADEAHARALEETQQQLRALAASALTAPRWQARRTVVLRAEPTVAATALARLPAGTEVVERARVGHWVHVELVSSPLGSPSSGWVYQRHLTLVARTAALDHPSAPK